MPFCPYAVEAGQAGHRIILYHTLSYYGILRGTAQGFTLGRGRPACRVSAVDEFEHMASHDAI